MNNRIERLQSKLEEQQIDALLVTNTSNRRYISGFTGSSGFALITKHTALFLTDFRYSEQAKQQCQGLDVIIFNNPPGELETLRQQLKEQGVKKLGFEMSTMSYGQYQTYTQKLTEVELVPVEGLIESLRLIKDESELVLIRKAVQIADDAFTHILGFLRPGITEIDVETELEFYMRKQGAKSSAFDIIVASGPRSALPHGRASERVLQPNEFITMDFGAIYDGYISDITRTVVLGEAMDKHHEIYNIVLEAQLKGVNDIKAGLTGKEADALTRDIISNYGYGEYFGHSTGHGIGLDVHEGPRLASNNETILEPGMIVTVEPGIYLPGFGG
ncbi:MAG: Xaa-Pro peptidase family protein, partial [Bacilli bacterium]